MSTNTHNTNNTSLPVREATIYWGPALLWMLAIFFLSAQSSLGEMTGSPAFMVARKSGHIFEYAVLALLLGRALLYTWRSRGEALSRALLSRAWLMGAVLSALYAMTDEFHQTFVPHRGGRIEDVLLDALSAVAALGVGYRLRSRQLEPRGPRSEDP
jgi:VanZ family protein